MNNLLIDHVQKSIIKENIDTLRVSIYRIRLLIEMHKKIGEKANIKHQNFWGFMQHNLIVGAVIVEIFSLFERSNGILKKFRKILEKNEISVITNELLDNWRSNVERHSEFRNKILAHKDISVEMQKVGPVHYADFLQVISELDEKLNVVEKMIEELQSFGSKISSQLFGENHFLDELELILS